MTDTAAYLSCAVLTIGVIFKLRQTRSGPRNRVLRLWCALALTLAAAAACLAPASVRLLNAVEPTDALANLLGLSLRLTAACLVGLIGRTVRSPDKVRTARWFVVLVLAIATMAALDFLADLPYAGAPAEGLRGRLALAGYDAVFMAYTSICLILAIHYVWRHAGRAPRSQVRLGLRLGIAAAFAALIWTAWTIDDIVVVLTHGSQDTGDDSVSAFFEAFCALTMTAGATFAVGTRWLRTWRDFRALGPLWSALHAEVPAIEFGTCRVATPWCGSFALYRRVIEIRDGVLALGGHRHPDLRQWTAGCRPATVEAVAIAAAIEAHRTGRRFPVAGIDWVEDRVEDRVENWAENWAEDRPGDRVGGRAGGRAGEPVGPVAALEPTLDAEAAWLTQVAREFQDSPVVARVRRWMAEGGGAAGISPG